MRIAFVSASRIPSDTANSIQVMKVCQAFAELGHEVMLLVPGLQPKTLKPTELMKHYGLHTLFNIEWMPITNRRFFPWRAVRWARRLNADLLYAWPIQSAALGLLRGLPVMLELHDLPAGTFGPLWFHLARRLPGQKRFLPITKALQTELTRRYGRITEGQAVIAPDGVDLERYACLPEAAQARHNLHLPEAVTVLCTGHLYAGRGMDLFLRLAGNFPQASFVWVGGKTPDMLKWTAAAKSQGMTNVTFTGFVANECIPLYQAAADVLLMPYGQDVATSSGGNTAAYCSPMKMFEYMAAGRAILTSDLPVLREVLNETMAVFCPPEGGAKWDTALSRLLTDEAWRTKLGQQAQEHVQAFAWTERARHSLEGFPLKVEV